MFGYIRPFKPELKLKEFSRYRAVYCGLCKTISKHYGQIPRLASTYDLTFLALLLLSLESEDYGQELERCMYQLGQKTVVANASDLLDFTAATAVLLAYYKIEDNVQDKENVLLNQSAKLRFSSAKKKASEHYQVLDNMIQVQMDAQRAIEQKPASEVDFVEAAVPFATLLESLIRLVPFTVEIEAKIMDALALFAKHLGSWIYVLDAYDDLDEDRVHKRWNPLIDISSEVVSERVGQFLENLEFEMDLAASLLPFYRDASIISNIVQMGLAATRRDVFAGNKLRRI